MAAAEAVRAEMKTLTEKVRTAWKAPETRVHTDIDVTLEA